MTLALKELAWQHRALVWELGVQRNLPAWRVGPAPAGPSRRHAPFTVRTEVAVAVWARTVGVAGALAPLLAKWTEWVRSSAQTQALPAPGYPALALAFDNQFASLDTPPLLPFLREQFNYAWREDGYVIQVAPPERALGYRHEVQARVEWGAPPNYDPDTRANHVYVRLVANLYTLGRLAEVGVMAARVAPEEVRNMQIANVSGHVTPWEVYAGVARLLAGYGIPELWILDVDFRARGKPPEQRGSIVASLDGLLREAGFDDVRTVEIDPVRTENTRHVPFIEIYASTPAMRQAGAERWGDALAPTGVKPR